MNGAAIFAIVAAIGAVLVVLDVLTAIVTGLDNQTAFSTTGLWKAGLVLLAVGAALCLWA